MVVVDVWVIIVMSLFVGISIGRVWVTNRSFKDGVERGHMEARLDYLKSFIENDPVYRQHIFPMAVRAPIQMDQEFLDDAQLECFAEDDEDDEDDECDPESWYH